MARGSLRQRPLTELETVQQELEQMSTTDSEGRLIKNAKGFTYHAWLVEARRAGSEPMRWAWSKNHDPKKYRDLLTEPKLPEGLRHHFEKVIKRGTGG